MKPFRERNPVVIGLIGFAVILLLMLGAFRADKLPIIGAGDVYHADFAEIGSLKSGNEVRIAGVPVGKVEGVSLDGDKVDVKFKIDKGVKLGRDTGASVGIRTLLGATYLAIEPSGSGTLKKGSTIPVSRTRAPYDVVDAFSDLSTTTDALDIDEISKALSTLADVAAKTPREFKGAIKGVSDLSRNLADRDDQIDTLLQNLKKVTGVLNSRNDQLESLFKDASVLFEAVSSRRDSIHRLLVSTQQISTELSALVKDTRADLKPALTQLDTVTTMLRKNEASLDESLRVLPGFFRVFSNALGVGPWFETYVKIGGWRMTTVMARFSGLTKVLTAFVVLALLLAMLVVFAGGNDTRKLTVDFESTNSLYVGSDVRILGVAVGKVDKLKARGDSVRATLSYKSDVKLPDDVKAVIVSPAIVGDRFVQLTPAYSGGPVLADGARLGVKRTAVPVELDQIFQSIDDLSVALGPKGANKNGALSSLIEDSADQLNGQGAQLNETLKNFGRLSQTLSDNKDNLFGSVREVNQFVDLLQRNDDSVRAFFDSTAKVSQVLEGEREDLKGTLAALSKALIDVRTLVKENRSELRGNVDNLQRIARVLANHQDDLKQIAIGGPTALSNVAVTYNGNPGVGSLDNRSNLINLVGGLLGDPVSVFCNILAEPVPASGQLCDGLADIVDGILPTLPRSPAASTPVERPDRMNDSVADMLAVK